MATWILRQVFTSVGDVAGGRVGGFQPHTKAVEAAAAPQITSTRMNIINNAMPPFHVVWNTPKVNTIADASQIPTVATDRAVESFMFPAS
jgi:hypothetical protein